MTYTAKELSLLLNGKLEGDENIIIERLAKIEDATELCISFIANPKYAHYYETTKAGVLVVNDSFAETVNKTGPVLIKVADAYSAFTVLLNLFDQQKDTVSGIDSLAFVHPTAKISKSAHIAAFAYIGENAIIGDNSKILPHCYLGNNVTIGSETILNSGVKIYFGCSIGNECILHSGAVIGSDGFGFAPQKDGSFSKIAQIGNVIIENKVEIGANTTIDRATMGSTIIRNGVKLDNLVHIAHNVEVGENTVIAAQSGVSGSTKIESNCIIGGQVGLVGHLTIAKGSQINAQSGISKSIKEEGKKWNGTPAFDFTESLKSVAVYRKLPQLERKIIALENKLAILIASK